jgi:hypothetical protein
LYAMSSSMIHGVGRDAARIVRAIQGRLSRMPSRAVPLEPATVAGTAR